MKKPIRLKVLSSSTILSSKPQPTFTAEYDAKLITKLTKECTCCNKTQPLYMFYARDIYCKSCRKNKESLYRFNKFHNKVTLHFQKANSSTYFQALDQIFPGLSYFKEHIIASPNIYYHFLQFSSARWFQISKIYSSQYHPINCPTSAEISTLRKVAKYITREKQCKRCLIYKPTYYIYNQVLIASSDSPPVIISPTSLIDTDLVLELLQAFIANGKITTQIRYNQFQASYQSYDGWKATCTKCLSEPKLL